MKMIFDRHECILRLKEIMVETPMSMAELARELNISYATVARWMDERHTQPFSTKTLRKLKEYIIKYDDAK